MSALSAADAAREAHGARRAALVDLPALEGRLAAGGDPLPALGAALATANERLDARYRANDSIAAIVADRAWLMDRLLALAWQRLDWPRPDRIALVAVGGYGRGELLPHSDIDILALTRGSRRDDCRTALREFHTLLWDLGLDVSQTQRSARQCREEARRDVTVATALMESRTIHGLPELREHMSALVTGRRVWPLKKFLRAKWDEQLARYEKYHDIDHALEPNVKTSPGGLRDLQTIAWIAKRRYGTDSLKQLAAAGILRPPELSLLLRSQLFLWRLRYGLHLLAGRREDRLLFERQRELAALLGFEDDERSLGVEKLMKRYYRMVGNLRELNDVLLQHFDEDILRAGERKVVRPLNRRFQVRNDYLEVTHPEVFARCPFALLETFAIMAQDPAIKGVRAATIRQLRHHRRLIDDGFRAATANRVLFMTLLRSPHGPAPQLRRMARYGLLGRYLPEFGRIAGQMQHDLFHIYTVDAHTLQVIENMQRLREPGAERAFPEVAEVARKLPKIELLYIAGLYHDIAKGRGGDHSKLGMADAEAFCARHRLSAWDTRLVVWLVERHLLMSTTAQRKDIDDPEVIREFALAVGDKLHLDYLYALTVADIRATNPDLWNSWRASLLRSLYLGAKQALRRGLENPVARQERIADKKAVSARTLAAEGLPRERIELLWATMGDEYFLRESAANIAWHGSVLAGFDGDYPLVAIRALENPADASATLVFIHAPNADYLFANSMAAFAKLGLGIVGARVFTLANDFCMDTYTVLEPGGAPVAANPERCQEIRRVLRDYLSRGGKAIAPASYRRSRKERYFGRGVHVSAIDSSARGYTTLEVNCPHQPGILVTIATTLAEWGVSIKDARINTLGERKEDLFFITDRAGRPFGDERFLASLTAAITERITARLGA